MRTLPGDITVDVQHLECTASELSFESFEVNIYTKLIRGVNKKSDARRVHMQQQIEMTYVLAF